MSGPPSFLIDINDLLHAVHNSVISMYAEDTIPCYKFSDIISLMKLSTTISYNWKLGLNSLSSVTSTNSMPVSTKQKQNILKSWNDNLHLKIRNKELEMIEKMNYLSLPINSSLNWKEHIKTVSTLKFPELLNFKAYHNFPTTGNTKIPIHRYFWATISVSLLCLGLRWFDWA